MTFVLETSSLAAHLDGLTVRVGCDIVALDEIEQSLDRFGDRFLRRVFAEAEIRECAGANRLEKLAARFAAKEAAIKAFNETDASFPLSDIAVSSTQGAPILSLTGDVARRACEHGWVQTALSLSHTRCHAMATVMVLRRSV